MVNKKCETVKNCELKKMILIVIVQSAGVKSEICCSDLIHSLYLVVLDFPPAVEELRICINHDLDSIL